MRTAAILPVKRFSRAKQRLAVKVAAQPRERLAQAMVADVLDALAGVAAIERTIIVTREPLLAELARPAGAVLLDDEAEAGQSQAVAIGVRHALENGYGRVLCIPGDCPALDARELDLLLAQPAHAPTEVVIVPDRHGSGTNGLLLTPPDAIAASFGPDSARRHVQLARSAGAAWRIERLSSLLLDIDTGADLAALREALSCAQQAGRRQPAKGPPAARTRALLAEQAGEAESLSLAGGR